jgi:Cu(I)/Ag(I) efflux system membrane fusion protein
MMLAFLSGCGNKAEQRPEIPDHGHEGNELEASIVRLDKHKVFHAGIRVEEVQKKSAAIPLSLPGKVMFNERRRADITARVDGRVERLHVYVNDRIEAGDVLAELYSQEYLALQAELIQASRRWKKPWQGADSATARSIYESARRKILFLGVPADDVRTLEDTQVPEPHFKVRAPLGGTVLESLVRQGSVVRTGTELFELADLSTVWILADVYEQDLPHVRSGMRAAVEVSAFSESFNGTLTSMYSVVDEKTRTVKARVELPNTGGKLKPGMFCTVKIATEVGKETIKIPASALLGDAEKHFVFVADSDTTFEKRDIRTGVETREFAEVLDGLLEGERIVVKGGFFLKSELARETFSEEH